jgi:hypothetical protein
MLEIVAGAKSAIGKSCRKNESFRESIFDPYHRKTVVENTPIRRILGLQSLTGSLKQLEHRRPIVSRTRQ